MAEYNDVGNDTDPENVDGDDPVRDAIQSKPVRYQDKCNPVELSFFEWLSWEATVTGGLEMGGFQTGYCNLEKSALYFICKRGNFTLLKPKQNKKEGAVLKV